MKTHQKGASTALVVLIIIIIIAIIVGLYFYFKTPTPTAVAPTTTPTSTATTNPTTLPTTTTVTTTTTTTTGWPTYSNPQVGVSFQYPTTPNTTFASVSFQGTPTAFVTTSTTANTSGNGYIDAKGCYYPGQGNQPSSTSQQLSLSGVNFCASSYGDVGAGQLYTSYYYTTKRNGSYITLQYIVHTPNGCGAFSGTDQTACQNVNPQTAFIDPIQQSVSTLAFTK